VPCDLERQRLLIPRSTFTDKNSQEAFELKVHKRIVEIIEPTDKTIDSLMHLELPAGVDIEVKM
jgi:small subunit ribosomal protein S10